MPNTFNPPINSTSYMQNDKQYRPMYQLEDLRSKINVRDFDAAPTAMSTEFEKAADVAGREILDLYTQSGQGNDVSPAYTMAIDAVISSAFGLDYKDVARNHKYYTTLFAGEDVEDRGFIEALSKAWELENNSRDIANLQNRFDMSEDETERNMLLKQIEGLELKAAQLQDYTDRGWLGNNAVNTAPIMNQLSRTLLTTYVPAVLMGSVATLATGGAAAPAAVGGILKAITATRAFQVGAGIGRGADLVFNSFARIKGQKSRELYNMVDENGNRMDDTTRGWVSFADAALETMIEYMLPEPGLEGIIPGGLSKAVSKAIGDNIANIGLRTGARLLTGAVSESTEEALQSLVSDLSNTVAKSISNEYGITEYAGRPFDEAIRDYMSNAWDSFSQAFIPSLFAAVPGTAYQTARNVLAGKNHKTISITPEMRTSAESFQNLRPGDTVVPTDFVTMKSEAPSSAFMESITIQSADGIGTSSQIQKDNFQRVRVKEEKNGSFTPVDEYNANLAKYLHDLGAEAIGIEIVRPAETATATESEINHVSRVFKNNLTSTDSIINVSSYQDLNQFVENLRDENISVNMNEDGTSATIAIKDENGNERIISVVVDNGSAISENKAGQSFDDEYDADPVKDSNTKSRNGAIFENPPAQEQDYISRLAADINRTSQGRIDQSTSRALASLYSIMPEEARSRIFSRNNGRLVFSESETGRTLSRRQRGATLADSLKVILNENSRADTFIHESSHVIGHTFPEVFRNISSALKTSLGREDERALISDFLEENRSITGLDYATALSILDGLPEDGNFNEQQEELVVNMAVANARTYTDESASATLPERVRKVFRELANAINRIYQTITGKTQLPENVRQAFNDFFTLSDWSAESSDTRIDTAQNADERAMYQMVTDDDGTQENAISWGMKKYTRIPNEQLLDYINNDVYIPDYTLKSKLSEVVDGGTDPDAGIALAIREEITAREEMKAIPDEEKRLAEDASDADSFITSVDEYRKANGLDELSQAKKVVYRKYWSYFNTPTLNDMIADFKQRFGTIEGMLELRNIVNYKLVNKSENERELRRVNSKVSNMLNDLAENPSSDNLNNILKSVDDSPRMWLTASLNAMDSWGIQTPYKQSMDVLVNYLYMSDNDFDFLRRELRSAPEESKTIDSIESDVLDNPDLSRLSDADAEARLNEERQEKISDKRLFGKAIKENIQKLKDDMRIIGKVADREMNRRRELETELDNLVQEMARQENISAQKLSEAISLERLKAASTREEMKARYEEFIENLKKHKDEVRKNALDRTRKSYQKRIDKAIEDGWNRVATIALKYNETKDKLISAQRAYRRAERARQALAVKYATEKTETRLKRILKFSKGTTSASYLDPMYWVYYYMHDGKYRSIGGGQYVDADYDFDNLVNGDADNDPEAEVLLYPIDEEGNPLDGIAPFEGRLGGYEYDKNNIPEAIERYLPSSAADRIREASSWKALDLGAKKALFDALSEAKKDAQNAYKVAKENRLNRLDSIESDLTSTIMRNSPDFMSVSPEDRKIVADNTGVLVENVDDATVLQYKRRHPDQFVEKIDDTGIKDRFATPILLWGKMIQPFVRKLDGKEKGAFYKAFVERPLASYQEMLRQKQRRIEDADKMFQRTLGEKGSARLKASREWLSGTYEITSNTLGAPRKTLRGNEVLGVYIYSFNVNGIKKLYSTGGNNISLEDLARINPEATRQFIDAELRLRQEIEDNRIERSNKSHPDGTPLLALKYKRTIFPGASIEELNRIKAMIDNPEFSSIIPENIRKAGDGMIALLKNEQGRFAQSAFRNYNLILRLQDHYFPLFAKGRLTTGETKQLANKKQKIVQNGNMKERNAQADYELELDVISSFYSAIDSQERFNNMTDVTNDLNSIMGPQGGIGAVVTNRYGKRYADYLQWYINTLTGDTMKLTEAEKVMNKIIGNVAVSKIGLNLMTTVKQLVSIIPAVTQGEINIGDFSVAAFHLMTNRDSYDPLIESQAPEIMRSSINLELERLRTISGQSVFQKTSGKVQDFIMKPIEAADRGVKKVVWLAAYEKEIRNGKSMAEATASASSLVQRTQSMSDPFSITQAQQSRNPFTRVALLFTNDLFHMWNIIFGDTYLDIKEGNVGRVMERFSGVMLSAALLSFLGASWLPDDEDDEMKPQLDEFTKDFVSQMAQYMTPIFGSFWSEAFSGFDSSLLSILKDVYQSTDMAYKSLTGEREYTAEEWFSQVFDSITGAASAVFPFPYVAAGRAVDAFMPNGREGATFNPWYFLGANVGKFAELFN